MTIWHPQQGLWNRALISLMKQRLPTPLIRKIAVGIIIYIDTTILFCKALKRRVHRVGVSRLFSRPKVQAGPEIIYFDLGTYKDGRELTWMVNDVLPNMSEKYRAIGFEANPQSYQIVSQKFESSRSVTLVNAALCYSVPENGMVRLYKDMKNGLGDSVYREGHHFEEIAALRLSDWIREHEIDIENNIALLRMNIEGAELDVLRDLSENGHLSSFDGFYGMWDDLAKQSRSSGQQLEGFISKNDIYHFTFNGRDMKRTWRRWCIWFDLQTSVLASPANQKN